MTRVVRVARFGGPEVLEFESVEIGDPAPRQVRLRQTAVGLNFIDVYERTGLYPNPLPCGLGREAAGVVEAVGSAVRDLKVGDRVAYVLDQSGAYAEARLVPADRVVKLPARVSDEVAAATMLKGLTAQFLLRRTYRVRKGDFVLIHAAAGGVGSIAVQWARHLGARVIGVVGNPQKAELARSRGADHVLLTTEDLVARVREITDRQGVAVVYDSVGKDTFFASLDCLRPLGMMVTFGNASGPVPPIAPLELSKRGSLFLTRPTLFHYIARRADLVKAARELFDLLEQGVITAHIGQRHALGDVALAHRELEARRTTGSSVLLP